ncbi:MAG: hypothetical protein KGL39_29585 [Patescibacteria group bacterium]|nr:hypothetical protein [Patescibacteria group bacterium]
MNRGTHVYKSLRLRVDLDRLATAEDRGARLRALELANVASQHVSDLAPEKVVARAREYYNFLTERRPPEMPL